LPRRTEALHGLLDSAPTKIEREHYAKLIGRQITAIQWEQMEGHALPVLVLSGRDRDENVTSATVLMDPDGNGPGRLDHNL